MLDALEPFGFEHVFPRGTLREPLAGLRRADVVILSRADAIDPSQREAIRRRVQSLAPQSVWAEVRHAAMELISAGGTGKASGTQQAPLDSLKRCSGGGVLRPGQSGRIPPHNPVVRISIWPDFASFPTITVTPGPISKHLAAWADRLGAEAVLCTHKDLVKIGLDRLGRSAALGDSGGDRFSRRPGSLGIPPAGIASTNCSWLKFDLPAILRPVYIVCIATAEYDSLRLMPQKLGIFTR